ncbi:MAG: hypothetical protein WBD47_19560 [Phormidesmis sp.]
MFIKVRTAAKGCLGAIGLLLLAGGTLLPAQAQSIEPAQMEIQAAEQLPADGLVNDTVNNEDAAAWTPAPENLSAEALLPAETSTPAAVAQTPAPEADTLVYPVEDKTELAQARRRTRNTVGGSDFLGIGADFGYASDVSFALISKLSLNDQVAVRPSVLIGDDFSILLPVTYEFTQYSTNVGGFRLLPYVGAGASYSDTSDDGDNSDFNVLLVAGADAPISRRFTLNAQANLGVLNDTDFGVTVGVGYNFGRLIR